MSCKWRVCILRTNVSRTEANAFLKHAVNHTIDEFSYNLFKMQRYLFVHYYILIRRRKMCSDEEVLLGASLTIQFSKHGSAISKRHVHDTCLHGFYFKVEILFCVSFVESTKQFKLGTTTRTYVFSVKRCLIESLLRDVRRKLNSFS